MKFKVGDRVKAEVVGIVTQLWCPTSVPYPYLVEFEAVSEFMAESELETVEGV